MKRIQTKNLGLWKFDGLEKESAIQHFVTDRNSSAAEKEYTLSYSSVPDRNEIRHNRSLLATAMEIPEAKLFFPSQVHKTRIVNVTRSTTVEEVNETDALLTNEPGICIAVMSADCVPILLYDKKNKVVAAVHSGWRGTVAKITTKTLLQMQINFGTHGEDVLVGIGPSVCQDSYEVGEEVIDEVDLAFGKKANVMIRKGSQKAMLNLWEANRIQLLDFGVMPENIELANLCTVKNNKDFFSARQGDSGRFCAGIMLKTEVI